MPWIWDDIRQNGPLGHVTNGWFAQTANFVESAGGLLPGGKSYYNNVTTEANTYVDGVNKAAIQQGTQNALNNGATQQQAQIQGFQYANTQLQPLHSPQTAGEVLNLLGSGTQVATKAAGVTVTKALGITPGDSLGALMPLLVGAGVIGAGYLAVNAMGSNSSSPRSNRSNRRTA